MISGKILNQLRNAKTADGMVGMEVKSSGELENLAWISIQIPNRTTGFEEEFKVEYLELKPEWRSDNHDGWDWDQYIVNEQTEFARSTDELQQKLERWTRDFDDLTPIANLDHPKH